MNEQPPELISGPNGYDAPLAATCSPEDLPDEAFGEDEAEGSHLFGSMKAGGDEHAAERRGGFRDPRLTAAATA